MFILLARHEIDDIKWNELITNSPQSYFYGFSWYLDLVSPNWKALIIVENNDYQAVMPLPIHSFCGIAYLKQPLFCQQLGIFSKPNYVISYADFFAELEKSYKYIAEYSFNIDTQNIANEIFGEKFNIKFKTQKFHTHLLNLQQNITQIYANYSHDRKINLKCGLKFQAQKGIKIIESTEIDSLINMFINETEQKLIGGVASNAYNLLRKVYAELQHRKMVKIFYTSNQNNEIESGIMVVFSHRKIVYLFNAAQNKFRKNNGRTLLIHHILETYSNSEYDFFDFESPEIPKIVSFYKSFGSVAYPFLRIHYNNLPFWVEIPKKIRKFIVDFSKL